MDTESLRQWIFERTWNSSGSTPIDFLKRSLRFVALLLLSPIVLITKNDFKFVSLFDSLHGPRCLVRINSNDRVKNIIVNTLVGFTVFDLQTHLVFCMPNLKRIFNIILDCLRHDNYPIFRMAQVYDLNQHQSITEGFEYFTASDGATPFERTLCHHFNLLDKITMRITPSYNGYMDYNFNYNFVPETFKGQVGAGWTIIKGSPWRKAAHPQKREGVIGIIGSPNGIRLFGLEYGMVILAKKLKNYNYKVKIRLHPQAYKFSNYLVRNIFRIDTSVDEMDSDFIESCECLISSYRSSLIDLALSSGVLVIVDEDGLVKELGNCEKSIFFTNLKNNDPVTVNFIRSKLDEHSVIENGLNANFPSVLEVVSN